MNSSKASAEVRGGTARSNTGRGYIVVATEENGRVRLCNEGRGCLMVYPKRKQARNAAKAARQPGDIAVEVVRVSWLLRERTPEGRPHA